MPASAAGVVRPQEASPAPGIVGDLGGLQLHPLAEEKTAGLVGYWGAAGGECGTFPS